MPEFEVFVNDKLFKTSSSSLTGDQIKSLAGVAGNYELFLVHGNTSEPIGPSQSVEMKNGEHFRAIPPGTFGKTHAAPTTGIRD